MPTRETCNFSFATSLDKRHTVRILNPDAAISPAVAKNVADMFLTANPFDESIGDLKSLLNIEKVSITRTVLV